MLPKLPRYLLWDDLSTIDAFLRLDRVNVDLYNVLRRYRNDKGFDETKIFNEVYYQTTRILYEDPIAEDFDDYLADIKANMGWKSQADLVVTMIYCVFALMSPKRRTINEGFFYQLQNYIMFTSVFTTFDYLVAPIRRRRKYLRYSFKPRPYPTLFLQNKYINWEEVTNGFEASSVENLFNLWDNDVDRGNILNHIESYLMINETTREGIQRSEKARMLVFTIFARLQMERGNSKNKEYVAADDSVGSTDNDEKIKKLNNENSKLRQRIQELETENEQFKAQTANIEDEKTGENRVFTLKQIVDYSKNKCRWEDVKDIVPMLYKLLAKGGQDEDYKLVESIEEYFKMQMTGNTTIEHADNVYRIPQVGTFNQNVEEQNNTFPTPQIGVQQKKIGNE